MTITQLYNKANWTAIQYGIVHDVQVHVEMSKEATLYKCVFPPDNKYHTVQDTAQYTDPHDALNAFEQILKEITIR